MWLKCKRPRPGRAFIRLRPAITSLFTLGILAGCGGAEEIASGALAIPNDYYGAIAINKINGAGRITSNYSSQFKANEDAKKNPDCEGNCEVVVEFSTGQCAALAIADNLTFGWASDSNQTSAKLKALNECTIRNGRNCSVKLSECNSDG